MPLAPQASRRALSSWLYGFTTYAPAVQLEPEPSCAAADAAVCAALGHGARVAVPLTDGAGSLFARDNWHTRWEHKGGTRAERADAKTKMQGLKVLDAATKLPTLLQCRTAAALCSTLGHSYYWPRLRNFPFDVRSLILFFVDDCFRPVPLAPEAGTAPTGAAAVAAAAADVAKAAATAAGHAGCSGASQQSAAPAQAHMQPHGALRPQPQHRPHATWPHAGWPAHAAGAPPPYGAVGYGAPQHVGGAYPYGYAHGYGYGYYPHMGGHPHAAYYPVGTVASSLQPPAQSQPPSQVQPPGQEQDAEGQQGAQQACGAAMPGQEQAAPQPQEQEQQEQQAQQEQQELVNG